jgi:hypothetical protein
VIGAPVRILKVGLEEVAFGDVGSPVGRYSPKFVHAAVYAVRGFAAPRNVGLVIANSGIRGALAVGTSLKREAENNALANLSCE